MSNLTNRIRHGDIVGVQEAIQSGVPLCKLDKNHNTPLHIAVMEDQIEIACLLLKSGADPAMKNRAGKTPADIDTDAGKHVLKHSMECRILTSKSKSKKTKI